MSCFNRMLFFNGLSFLELASTELPAGILVFVYPEGERCEVESFRREAVITDQMRKEMGYSYEVTFTQAIKPEALTEHPFAQFMSLSKCRVPRSRICHFSDLSDLELVHECYTENVVPCCLSSLPPRISYKSST